MKNLMLLLILLLRLNPSLAIDNPDTPDLVSAFEVKTKPFEEKINLKAGGASSELSGIFGEYEKFLDAELNTSYKNLLKQLQASEIEELKKAQRSWLKFKESEFLLIDKMVSKDKFGSSYQLARGNFRTKIFKDRITQLHHFSKLFLR